MMQEKPQRKTHFEEIHPSRMTCMKKVIYIIRLFHFAILFLRTQIDTKSKFSNIIYNKIQPKFNDYHDYTFRGD